MTSKILIEDLKIYAHHGVLPEETACGTYYLVTVELHCDLWKATESDALADTINYAEVNALIHKEMQQPSQLLERVCGRIIEAIHRAFPQISYLKIRLTKTAPPMQGEMRGVSVEFEKSFA